MNKLKIAQIIAGLSVVIGFTVMIGWYFDLTILTSIMPGWIRMKFATAVCFILSGIILYFLTFDSENRRELRQSVLIIFSTLLVLVMGTLFLGSILGFQTGMENIAFIDIHEINTPIFQGRPSVATVAAFLLISLIGYFSSADRATKRIYTIIGLLVCTIGTVGALGYLIGFPALYYEIPGLSNAIALNTTILFSFLGVAIILIGQERKHTYGD